VNSFSSAYNGTIESEVAAKKPHKNEENRRFFVGGFQRYKKLALENQYNFSFLLRWLLFCAKSDSP
jgi:hypothetical protein